LQHFLKKSVREIWEPSLPEKKIMASFYCPFIGLASHPGEVEILLAASHYRNQTEISASLMSHLARMQALPTFIAVEESYSTNIIINKHACV